MSQNKTPQKESITNFLWQVIKPYSLWYLLIFQAPALTAVYVFANNYSLKLLIDAFSEGSNASLAYPVSIFISAQILLDVIWRLSNIGQWKAEPYVKERLLLRAYNYIQYHSYVFFQNTPSGTILSKLKGILSSFEKISTSLHYSVGKNFCVVIVSIFVLWLINTQVFLFMLGWCILFVCIMYPMALKLNALSNQAAESEHQIMGLFADYISNMFSLFYFASRHREIQRAQKTIETTFIPKQIATYRYDFKFNVIGAILYWVMLLSVFLFMIHLRQTNSVSTGDFVFVMLTTIALSFDLWAFTTGMCDFLKELGNFKSSFSILEIPHQSLDDEASINSLNIQGAIRFANTSFGYHDKSKALSNINLSINAGEKIGIIGHSGAGKSTLVSLLLKNFKATEGTIFIDNTDILAIESDCLRKQITIIPQDILLFHRSIAENIGYAKEGASQEEIENAAKMANIHDFILSLPEGYKTEVGERGIKLSGGQRQRIAIARAFLKNAPVIILDEATSSLDSLTEQQIQQSIHEMLEQKNATVIAIAHRLSTIRHMDRIIVMEDGKIIEEGSFNALMAEKDSYSRKLWDSQVNGMVI